MSQVLQLEELINGQKFGRFNINLLAWSFLAMVADGFDIAGLASAAPDLARTWHVAPAALTMASAVMLSGFCTLGAQFGNNAASGLLYPTSFRSRGVGWALGIGRFGSMLGPLVGGMLLGLNVPVQQFFLLAAVPMGAGLIASVSIARLCYRKFGGVHLDEMADAGLPNSKEALLADSS